MNRTKIYIGRELQLESRGYVMSRAEAEMHSYSSDLPRVLQRSRLVTRTAQVAPILNVALELGMATL